ncbi:MULTISPECIES: ROK family protein [unclassified Aureimonas]|uniref:ROK family protein n=1 Tax=unclassified Aureimonas TaxID=2615206 RepID=UPI0006FD9C75|nr:MULTISPECIES: ROK family protein [unclassified Aureimonas]KQT69834.1 glucokinase [Aureimonas sp. Leaf427]KQT76014.1 glucokinase [Aureimonas sp. Leaf460]
MAEPLALAVDLGGTELRAAAVAKGGRFLAQAGMATDAAGGPERVVEQIVALLDDVRSRVPGAEILGLGVGAPGPLDPIAGIAIAPPTLKGWRDVPLARILGDRLSMPVRVENDANAAALGEWRYGAGRGLRSIVFVTVSTGIGGGVVADGRILHGRRGLAAEIGHMTITERGGPCFCGATGCFEAVASGSALGWSATAATRPGDGSRLRALAEDGPVTARHVVAAAREGDSQALALLAEEARWLGIGFTNLLHLYSPEAIVVGGGLSAALDLMEAGIARTIADRAMPAYRDVPVVPAGLGGQAGLAGAASLVLDPG